jgi:hypothetical protein
LIDKPVANGGLALSRPLASAVIAAVIVALLVILPQRPGHHPGQKGPVDDADRQPAPGSDNPNP